MPTRLADIHIEHESSSRLVITCDKAMATRIAGLVGVERVVHLFGNHWAVEMDKRYVAAEVEREIAALAQARTEAQP